MQEALDIRPRPLFDYAIVYCRLLIETIAKMYESEKLTDI
jgi:hypothetical protein